MMSTNAPDGASRHARPQGAEIVVSVIALAVVLGQAFASRFRGGWLWGGDGYAFLPAHALWIALGVGLAVAWLVAWRLPATAGRQRRRQQLAGDESPQPPAGAVVERVLRWGLLPLVAALGLWVCRARHVLLGDGIPMTQLLPDAHDIHPREPLASLLQQLCYRVLEPVFAAPGVPRAQVVMDCVAAGSVLAGALFVLVAPRVSREIVRAFPAGEPACDPAIARPRTNERRLAWAITLALLAQGYVQMFFGYVENYAYPCVVAALFVVTSLRFLRGAGSLLLPLATAALAVALDFTAVVLGPPLLVVIGYGLADPARRRGSVRDLLLAIGFTAAAVAWLTWGPPHYPVMAHLATMLASGRAGAGYLLSAAHVRDFLNEHLLVGPFGLLLFAPTALLLGWQRARPSRAVVFLLVAGLTVVIACWGTPDLPLGYARDWDLFTPLAVVLAAASVGLVMSLLRDPAARWRTATLIAVVSLYHTLPWIALNASAARSLERFKTLPLGGGRTENTVAFWYAQHRDFAEAKRWLDRSLAIDPRNNRALDLVGRIAFEEHRPRRALQAYLIAVTLRPDKPEYREQLAAALAASGGPEAGLCQLDTLAAGKPEDGVVLFERALLLRAGGRASEARAARARALRLRPDLAALADSLPVLATR
jgi:hypothetical protein